MYIMNETDIHDLDVLINNKESNSVTDTEKISDGEEHVLNTPWEIWYHHTLNDWSISGYRKIFTISTIKDYWDIHNKIDYIGGITNLNFFMMRKNITPIWEDPKNRHGGCWSVLIPLNKTYEVWELLTSYMIGETITTEPEIVTGISINVKNNVSVIKLWNNDRTKKDQSLLPSFLREYGNIIYKNHQLDY